MAVTAESEPAMATDEERTPLLPPSQNAESKVCYDLAKRGLSAEAKSNQADWDSPDDPENPKNWSARRKWTCALVVSFYALMGPVSSAMVVPALPQISQDLNIESDAQTSLLVSIFVLGWCLGPLIAAPLSEILGRSALLNYGHALFLVVNTLCGFAQTKLQLFTLRLLAGFVGSTPLSLGAGIMSDLWISEERGRSLSIYTVMPLLGPAIGPIAGGYLISALSWRWIFHASSIFTAASLLIGLLTIPETFAPVLLKWRKIARTPSNTKIDDGEASYEKTMARVSKFLKVDLVRPFILLGTQPIIQVLALFMGYLFGLNYLTICTFQNLWVDEYGMSIQHGSLNYLSIGLGFLLATEIGSPLNDMIYSRARVNNGYAPPPEVRTVLMVPASLLVPIGQLVYGWSASHHLHFLVPNVGVFLYSFGLILSYQCIQAYVLDCYPVYAASAIGSLTVLRSLGGFLFPLFAASLYRALGYGWASTVLAGCAVIVGVPAPWLLRAKGPALRARSPYASGEVMIEL